MKTLQKNTERKKSGIGASQNRSSQRPRIINISLIIITISLLGLHLTKVDYIQEENKKHEALEIFMQIDDLAHTQFACMEARGNPSGYEGYNIFQEVDSGFHNSDKLEEKFERAKKMMTFFDTMDEELHRIGALTNTGDKQRDAEYHKLKKAFDEIILENK